MQNKPPLELLSQAWKQTHGCKAVGFKLNLGQSAVFFNEVLSDPDIKKIIISRRNRIRSFVSEMNAEKTGIWESFPESEPMPHPGPLHLKAADLLKLAERNRAYYCALRERLDRTGQTVLELEYERLGEKEQHRRALNYLELSPEQVLVAATSRMNRGSLRSLISNFEQLERELAGTGLQHDLWENKNV
jgi:LPS sulfotransferase NodH